MRTLLSVVASSLLLVALTLQGQAQDDKNGGSKGGKADAGAKGKGGGGGARNLQVLDPNSIPGAMQSFVQGLGLLDKGTCAYCHVEDRTSDEKEQKVTARKMITMVRELNARFQDGKQHVTCWTCHRGSTVPLMAP